MKVKIVIKSFSALSHELMLRRIGTTDLGSSRLAHPRLRFKPDSGQGLNVQPDSLAVTEPALARSA